MIKQVSLNDFVDEFASFGRAEQFSYDGLVALFDYMESYEQDTGESYELDVIELCSNFSEYESLEEYNKDYRLETESIEDIEVYTIMVSNDSFIIQDY